jgi:hypothetical protein
VPGGFADESLDSALLSKRRPQFFRATRHDISRSIDPVKFNQSIPTFNRELNQMLRLLFIWQLNSQTSPLPMSNKSPMHSSIPDWYREVVSLLRKWPGGKLLN